MNSGNSLKQSDLKGLRRKRIRRISLLSIFFIVMGFGGIALTNKPLRNTESSTSGDTMPFVTVSKDLTDIQALDTLRIMVDQNSSSLFINKGRIMGFEYDLFKIYAAEIGVHLDVHVSKNLLERVDLLNSGSVDIIAMGLPGVVLDTTSVALTRSIYFEDQVLIKRESPKNSNIDHQAYIVNYLTNSKPLLKHAAGLENFSEKEPAEIALREGSMQMEWIKQYLIENPSNQSPRIIGDNGELKDEDFVSMVSNGEIDYTIIGKNSAKLITAKYENIDASTLVTEDVPVSFVVRKNSKQLLESLNSWIKKIKSGALFNITYNNYFKNQKVMDKRQFDEFCSINGHLISPYDNYIKAQAERLGWDWTLLAAMIYQESSFDPKAHSGAGAKGLMQIISPTAKRFNLKDPLDPFQNIRAGVSYIESLINFWEDKIPNEEERINFVLASYNVGPGHLLDAQRLAESFHKDPNKWFGNTEETLKIKQDKKNLVLKEIRHGYCRASEPINYVKQIMTRWEYYQKIQKTKDESKFRFQYTISALQPLPSQQAPM